jgi:LmbE family N-acetylglucosaminyl deacetylase
VTGAEVNLIDSPGTSEEVWQHWIGLACLPIAQFEGIGSAVVIAAHPDDEVLGVGGTMAQLAAPGVRLRVIAVTDGEGSHPQTDPALMAVRRAAESAAALRVLQVGPVEVIRLRLPDTGLHRHEEQLVGQLRQLCAGYDLCLAPWEFDGHSDHEAAGRAARAACRWVMSYPVWMWHWAVPADSRVPWRRARQVPLPGGVALKKRAAIRSFVSQLTDRPEEGPVLTPQIVAHFTRPAEVLFGNGAELAK